MFRVEPHELLFIYAALGVALVFLTAFIHTIRRARRERAILEDMMRCGICAFQFRNANNLVTPRCPNCGALVEQKRHSAL